MAYTPKVRGEHYAFADAVIAHEIATVLKQRNKPSISRAQRASFNASVQEDKKARPGSPNGWYTATANSINREIESIARREVRNVARRMRLASLDLDGQTLGAGVAASVFGVAAAHKGEIAEVASTFSRRAFMIGGAALAATAVLAPSEAKADNYGYIATVKRGATGYIGSKRPTIQNAMGAGTRGDAQDYIPELQKGPKFA